MQFKADKLINGSQMSVILPIINTIYSAVEYIFKDLKINVNILLTYCLTNLMAAFFFKSQLFPDKKIPIKAFSRFGVYF